MSSTSVRAGAYRIREQDRSVQPRSGYSTNRTGVVYPSVGGVQQYPKSVITFEFYDSPHQQPANMTDASAAAKLQSSPQRRPARIGRGNSPKPVTRHQVAGLRKTERGGVGGKVLSQRTNSNSPTVTHGYPTASGYFTITAYLPFDGGKRLKVRGNEMREEGVKKVT